MGKSLRETIHERRRVLENPYAFVDELDEMNLVEQERRGLENPYALIESLNRANQSVARFDGISSVRRSKDISDRFPKQRKYTEREVERIVRDVHLAIWHDRRALFAGRAVDPLEILDPCAAFQYFGYDFDLSDSLGQFADPAGLQEVAGIVDQQQRKVRVSSQFSLPIRNFTAAHELGHAVLHETVGLHRDRPLSGSSVRKDQQEYEADKFASYFLMPGKIVCSKFEAMFGRKPFELNELTRFALGAAAEGHRKWPRTTRELSRHLASTTRFNGQGIVSLAEQFQVSVEAMAIRIEELDLVDQS